MSLSNAVLVPMKIKEVHAWRLANPHGESVNGVVLRDGAVKKMKQEMAVMEPGIMDLIHISVHPRTVVLHNLMVTINMVLQVTMMTKTNLINCKELRKQGVEKNIKLQKQKKIKKRKTRKKKYLLVCLQNTHRSII